MAVVLHTAYVVCSPLLHTGLSPIPAGVLFLVLINHRSECSPANLRQSLPLRTVRWKSAFVRSLRRSAGRSRPRVAPLGYCVTQTFLFPRHVSRRGPFPCKAATVSLSVFTTGGGAAGAPPAGKRGGATLPPRDAGQTLLCHNALRHVSGGRDVPLRSRSAAPRAVGGRETPRRNAEAGALDPP